MEDNYHHIDQILTSSSNNTDTDGAVLNISKPNIKMRQIKLLCHYNFNFKLRMHSRSNQQNTSSKKTFISIRSVCVRLATNLHKSFSWIFALDLRCSLVKGFKHVVDKLHGRLQCSTVPWSNGQMSFMHTLIVWGQSGLNKPLCSVNGDEMGQTNSVVWSAT